MEKTHRNLYEEIEYTSDGVVSKTLLQSENAKHTLFCMKGGTEISEHTSTREATVTVLQGKGVFTLEGEEIPMAPGVFIPMKANAKHSLKAEEDTAFVLGLVG